MGLFLQTVIVPGCGEEQVRNALETVAKSDTDSGIPMELDPAQCRYQVHEKGVGVLLNEDCIGFEDLASQLSKAIGGPLMLLYIYDGDYWGYFLLDNGTVMDMFNPVPDYFEELPEEEMEELKGNAQLVAEYFQVDRASIENYLVRWTDEILEAEEQKAYEEDEFEMGSDWQMADFMGRLGFPYEW